MVFKWRMHRLRARPELVIPIIALIIGFTALSVAPILQGSWFHATAAQAFDRVRKGDIIAQTAYVSGPLGVPANAPTGLTHYFGTYHGADVSAPLSVQLTTSAAEATTTCASPSIDLKVLVIAADGNEADLPAIRQELDYLGMPYTVYIAAQTPGQLTADKLSATCHANYDGVILTNGTLAYDNNGTWQSALTQQEWNTLWSFEATFGIRQVTWYTYPTADFGFQPAQKAVETNTTPLEASYTSDAKSVFTYVNLAGTLPIQYAYTYLAKPAADGKTQALLTDGKDNALALIHKYADGRQNLALTFDSNPYLVHTIVLGEGLVNWVTKGVFIGQRHIYLSAQVDDIFLDDDIWTPSTACGTSVTATTASYRMTGADLQAAVNWQRALNGHAITAGLHLDMTFNGYGTTGVYDPDTLTPEAAKVQGNFNWTNHTYDHLDLTNVDYATAQSEILQNDAVAAKYRFTNFSTLAMVTPSISGLTNPTFLQAAYAAGIRYVVTDASQPGYNNPSPNAGILNAIQPGILMIPRHPTNLYFNVSQPAEEEAEYNCIYHSYWGKNLTWSQIVDVESQTMLLHLLKGDMDPGMFHQPNLRAYDGTHSLLGDLLDATLQKYESLYTLPVKSLRLDQIGQQEAMMMSLKASGVTASITPGVGITLTAQHAATIPLTGVKVVSGASAVETYGGQTISYISLTAGQSVTLTLK